MLGEVNAQSFAIIWLSSLWTFIRPQPPLVLDQGPDFLFLVCSQYRFSIQNIEQLISTACRPHLDFVLIFAPNLGQFLVVLDEKQVSVQQTFRFSAVIYVARRFCLEYFNDFLHRLQKQNRYFNLFCGSVRFHLAFSDFLVRSYHLLPYRGGPSWFPGTFYSFAVLPL